MDLASLGEKKRAIFVCTPVNDTSFNYLVSMMYMQAFQQLYDRAEREYGGRLPRHVRFIMDEFYNTPPPDRFDNVLSTCRSYNLSCAVILQDIGQLKTMFEKEWESLMAQCDEFLYLGGNDTATHKYVSERLGKETIFSKTTSQTRGTHGSSSQNDQKVGTELMTPDAISAWKISIRFCSCAANAQCSMRNMCCKSTQMYNGLPVTVRQKRIHHRNIFRSTNIMLRFPPMKSTRNTSQRKSEVFSLNTSLFLHNPPKKENKL